MHLLQGQGGTWQGPSWSFVQAMAEDLNYSLQVVPLTEESFVRNPMRNSWWACIHMVAINETDLCVGDFRATAGRSRYMSPGAGFTSAVTYASLVRALCPAGRLLTPPPTPPRGEKGDSGWTQTLVTELCLIK
jgi:hypothetical protein